MNQVQTKMAYSAWLTNIAVPVGIKEFETESEAIEAGKKTGFEFSVYNHGVMVGYFTIPGGYHYLHDSPRFGPDEIDQDKLMTDMQCTSVCDL